MTTKMPHTVATELLTSSIQWAWIMSIGFFSATQVSYKDDLHKIAITVISMVIGTIVSFYVKVLLNKWRKKRNERN